MPTNLLWALCLSILLHLFICVIKFAPDRPASAWNQRGVSVVLATTLLGVAKNAESGNVIEPTVVPVANGETVQTPVELAEAKMPSGSDNRFSEGEWPLVPQPDRTKSTALPEPLSSGVVPEVSVYFHRSELTLPPLLQGEPSFDILEDSGSNKPSSRKLSLRLYINARGAVDFVEILDSTSPSAFEDAAVATFLATSFRPGEIDGTAVGSQVVFEIDFDAQSNGASHSSDSAHLSPGFGRPEQPAIPSAAQTSRFLQRPSVE